MEAQLGEPENREGRAQSRSSTVLMHSPLHKGVNSRRTQLQQVLDVFDPNVNFTRGRILGPCHLGEEKSCHATQSHSSQNDRPALQGPVGPP